MKRFQFEVDYITKIIDQRTYYVDAENKNEAKAYFEANVDSMQFDFANTLKSEKIEIKTKKLKKYNVNTNEFEEEKL